MAVVAGTATFATAASAAKIQLREEISEVTVPSNSRAAIYADVEFPSAEGAQCYGSEEEAHVGADPSGTIKFAGVNRDLTSKWCGVGMTQTAGALFIKQLSVSSKGVVKMKLTVTVKALDGCIYEVKALEGHETFPTLLLEHRLTGTAKIQKGTGSPPTCAKEVSVTANVQPYLPESGLYYEAEII